ncbi:MAG: NAD(P)H-dependent oxidoreductase [Promethearchaeota archaeon]
MKIVILNGSPKGDLSVTMQYILYIQKKFPQHEFEILNVAQQIEQLENNQEKFQAIVNEIKSSDGIIWGFPLYFMLVSSQYKRFIELISERNVEEAFKNKYAAILTTSIHFYDHTAINYMNAICDDFEMKFVDFFSADIYDLIDTDKRAQLINFADNFLNTIKKKIPTSRNFSPVKVLDFNYTPSIVENEEDKVDSESKKVIVVTDSMDESTNLGKMIRKLQNLFSSGLEIINLYDINIKGGCLGCIQCGYDNQCVYKGKDGLIEFWNTKLKPADIIIIAGNIKDRYLSSRWKMTIDRSFFNNHIPILLRKQIGFIISGPINQIPNLREILYAYVEIQGSNIVGIISDESKDSNEIDLSLQTFAKKLIKFSKSNYIKPPTFRAIGGKKILRDAVYGRMRFVFHADHKYYEEHGFYDFPHNDKAAKKMNDMLIPLINDNEKFRKSFYASLTQGMIKPLKSIVAKANKNLND